MSLLLVFFCWVIFILLVLLMFKLIVGPIKQSALPLEKVLQTAVKRKILSKEQQALILQYENQKKITEWHTAGLITGDQAQALQSSQKKSSLAFSFVSTLSYLGIGCICIGVIALIAANYDKIPPMMRLLVCFMAFVGCNMGAFWALNKKKSLYADLFLLASCGFVGALIGQVGQTFHLRGDFNNAVFLWTMLALPFTLFISKPYAACLWFAGFSYSLVFSEYSIDAFYWLNRHFVLPSFLIALFFVVFAVGKIIRKIGFQSPFWSVAQKYGVILMSAAVCFIDSYYSTGYGVIVGRDQVLLSALLPMTAIFPLVMTKGNPFMQRLILFLAVFGVVGVVAPLPALGIVFTLSLLSFAAYYFARENQLKAFNWIIVAFFARIVWAYFYLFMSLAKTGIGAILLGILILGGLKIWTSRKQVLINYIQKGK